TGRRIVVPDLVGHGRSDLGMAADLTIAGHATRLAGLLDALGITRAALVGHHAGALIAASLAVSRRSGVTHLAMLNPIGGDVAWTGTLAVIRAFLPASRLLPPRVSRAFIHRELTRWFADPARGRLSIEQYMLALSGTGRWASFLRQLRALESKDVLACTSSLNRLTIPVAIMAGSGDPAAPPLAIERICSVLPHATLDIIKDGRHFTPEESPERVARLVARLVCP
ncbi:MAG TPA: alpha/beta hydrolase, partial [Gemmatimonadaceae bacterium]